jgi:HAD superfamily hydrolase (TIGR01509 family)
MQKGLLLDFDGTLVNSIIGLRRIYAKVLSHYDLHASHAEFDYLNGYTLPDIAKYLIKKYALKVTEADILQCYAKYLQHFYHFLQPNPGALALIQQADKQGRLISVVSSGSKQLIQQWLVQQNIEDKVAIVVAAEDVTLGKPNPEPYLTALHITGCDARQSIAVEDSLTGATAAMQAQIPTYLLGDTLPSQAQGEHPCFAGNIHSLTALLEKL